MCLPKSCGQRVGMTRSKIIGAFVGDKREGMGTYRYASGAVYEGQWTADKMQGTGTYR